MNIYIGNLSYDTTEEELKSVFEPFGAIDKLAIIKDKITGNSKGFGFVEMPNNAEAQAAIDGIKEIDGRNVTLNEARPRPKSGGFSSSGGGNKKFRHNRSRDSY